MTTSDSVFAGLAPAPVWAHFATLCRIPRPSKGEAALKAELLAWAGAQGLAARSDEAGNLLITKPASPGCAAAPGVVLQAHLDMVCQADPATAHDFTREPLRPVVDEGWVRAAGTTLGADNGLGVALILALLEDRTLVHGPLEALLTVDEEAGMGGARGLAADALAGRLMLNLDTEEWGEFYVGCAGGLDVKLSRDGRPSALPAGFEGHEIRLGGLRGGHSGVDIHEERGNAIKLLVRVLRDLETRFGLRLAALSGGSARNALPRDACARVALPGGAAAAVGAALADWQVLLRDELQGVDEGLRLALRPAAVASLLASAEQARWLAALHAAPHGVRRWSRALTGVVETSGNLGMVSLAPAGGHCHFMLRSLRDSGSAALAAEIASLFALAGCRVETAGHYPGWTPNPASPLLAVCQEVFRGEFGSPSRTQVIHAGLECGLLAAKYPDLDIVSFGPTIRGAHAPGERLEIASVARTWQLLTAILARLADGSP